jgi:tRNA A37 methylthiotransferase MiaB
MPNQVPFKLRKMRNAELRNLLADSGQKYQRHFLNRTIPVLWESVTEIDSKSWHLRGLTDNYLRVRTRASRYLWNQVTPVHITGIENGDLRGEIATS